MRDLTAKRMDALRAWDDAFRARFFAKTRLEQSGCLVWTGCRNKKGYGQVSIAVSLPAMAHRVAWALAHGAWPSDCLLHSCDNPPCVNGRGAFRRRVTAPARPSFLGRMWRRYGSRPRAGRLLPQDMACHARSSAKCGAA